MIEISDKTGPTAVNTGKVILMFYTDWCPRCPPVTLTLADLEKKYQNDPEKKFTFARIDFDKNPEAVAFFKIIGVPAILSIKNGTILKTWIGIPNLNICHDAVNTLM